MLLDNILILVALAKFCYPVWCNAYIIIALKRSLKRSFTRMQNMPEKTYPPDNKAHFKGIFRTDKSGTIIASRLLGVYGYFG
jgi:hypothetical protein